MITLRQDGGTLTLTIDGRHILTTSDREHVRNALAEFAAYSRAVCTHGEDRRTLQDDGSTSCRCGEAVTG